MKMLIGIIISGFIATFSHAYSDMDYLVIHNGVVDKNFKVTNPEKLNSILWGMNKKAIKRYPLKADQLTFHYAWIDQDGGSFKISIDNVNSIKELESTVPKGANLDNYIFANSLCKFSKLEPDLFSSNFFRVTLSGNLGIDIYDKNMRLFKSIKGHVSACQK